MPCIICYPSEVAGDAGFSALCVHPAAGCETSSQPNFSQISSASLLPETQKCSPPVPLRLGGYEEN